MNERTEPRLRSIDLGSLESELKETAKAQNTKPSLPPVSEFAPQPQTRKSVAANVTERYAMAAKAVLSMGDELRARIAKLEAQLAECDDVLRIVQEASDSIREKGTHAQLVIDEAHATADEIRAAVSEILVKIGTEQKR